MALTGLSAAEAGGLAGFETRVVHIAVEHGREVEDLDDPAVRVTVHQTASLGRSEVHPSCGPPGFGCRARSSRVRARSPSNDLAGLAL